MSKDDLIYDLIFLEKEDFIIDIGNYIPDIYKYGDFVDEIKDILRKSKVSIITNSVDVDSKTVIWKLKVRKCVITKQNSLYYRENSERIEILRIYDNRQNPRKLRLVKE